MAPTRPQSKSPKKPLRKIRILQIKRGQQKSFFSEYFYQTLLAIFAVLTFLLMGFGMRWDESSVIALWIVAILFVARQTWRVFRGEAEPAKAKEKKTVVLAEPVKNYKPPEVPRVSKDFSPLPPPGDKRYPPPSPFIKPPKPND
jgi:hypothetical protein